MKKSSVVYTLLRSSKKIKANEPVINLSLSGSFGKADIWKKLARFAWGRKMMS